MEETKKFNYKSDFDFIAKLTATNANRESVEVGFPDYDFELIITSGCNGYSTRSFVASSIGGVTKNCFNDNGQLHIVCDNHKLNVGELFGEFKAYLPNDIYPDGTQLNVEPQSLGIELVVGASDTPTTAEIELQLPYIYQSAYDLAVASGYEGSLEDYLRLSAELPEAVETAKLVKLSADSLANSASSLSESATSIDTNTNALTSLVSDWADGKAKIAEALTRKYSPTEATESFDAMAQKVMDLPLAVEGQEGIIDHTANGVIDGYDLLNELHKHQRQDYPYCCGVEFVPYLHKTVVLSGAEAYLCSDGFFTTEQEVEHTFAEDNKLSHYIIYYFSYPTYQVPTAINPAIKLIAYNGQPRFILSNYYCPVVQSYTNERYSVGSAEIGLDASSLVGDIMLSGIETMNGSIGTAADNKALCSISLPHLRNLESGGYIANHLPQLYNLSIPNLEVSSGTVAYECDILTNLELPSLNKVENGYIINYCASLLYLGLPNLTEISGGNIAYGCSKLKSLELPNLVKSSGGIIVGCTALESLSVPNLIELNGGNIIQSPTNIEELILPKLEKQTSGNILGYQSYAKVVRCPKLVSASSIPSTPLFNNCGKSGLSIDIYMPVITNYIPIQNIPQQLNFHLGTQQGCDIVFVTYSSITGVKIVTIEQGFRSSLNVSKLTSLTVESLQGIIDNLADNNDYEPLTLTLGTTLKNKLSEEYIAIATAKNYNIA